MVAERCRDLYTSGALYKGCLRKSLLRMCKGLYRKSPKVLHAHRSGTLQDSGDGAVKTFNETYDSDLGCRLRGKVVTNGNGGITNTRGSPEKREKKKDAL